MADNDQLAARISVLIQADILIMLTNVDGLYRHHGTPAVELIREVVCVDDAIVELAKGGNELGTGGMLSKIEATRVATEFGVKVVIANGTRKGVLQDILTDKCTRTAFLPQSKGRF